MGVQAEVGKVKVAEGGHSYVCGDKRLQSSSTMIQTPEQQAPLATTDARQEGPSGKRMGFNMGGEHQARSRPPAYW